MAQSGAVEIKFESVDPAGGVKNKNPIILLHAMLCSKEIWTTIPQTVANSTGRRVYTYDARNHGESPKTDESDFDFNVTDLFSVMDKIKASFEDNQDSPEKFVLVGHDMGGITAIKAALQKRDDFEMVIIVEMYARRVPDFLIGRVKEFVATWTQCIEELPKDTTGDDRTRTSVENLFQRLTFKEEVEKKSYQQGKFEYKTTETGYAPKYNTSALLTALEELRGQDKKNYYEGTYTGPAFFFYGTKSFYEVDKEEESMKKHFPNAELVKIDGGSHFLVADKAEELAAELIKIINPAS